MIPPSPFFFINTNDNIIYEIYRFDTNFEVLLNNLGEPTSKLKIVVDVPWITSKF